jgi:hypothetical protein
MFEPKGKSTMPSKALVPLSPGRALAERVDGIVRSRAVELERLGIAIGNNHLATHLVIGMEPLITSPATLSEYRLHHTFPGLREQLAAIRTRQKLSRLQSHCGPRSSAPPEHPVRHTCTSDAPIRCVKPWKASEPGTCSRNSNACSTRTTPSLLACWDWVDTNRVTRFG